MSEYYNLLHEVGSKIIEIRNNLIATAKEYIPKMYKALLDEHQELTPLEAREKIENDCKALWKKRTILHALPNEAKNQKKIKAGKQRHKNKIPNSAAKNAAPKLEEKKLIVDNIERLVSVNEDLSSQSSNGMNSIDNQFKENLDGNSNIDLQENFLIFEFSLKFRKVQQYMAPLYKIIGDNGDVYFHGKINTKSGKVVDANIGKINSLIEETQENYSDDIKSDNDT